MTAAYSVARVFPDAVVTLDSAREDESVDVVLGAGHQGMLSQEQVDQARPGGAAGRARGLPAGGRRRLSLSQRGLAPGYRRSPVTLKG